MRVIRIFLINVESRRYTSDHDMKSDESSEPNGNRESVKSAKSYGNVQSTKSNNYNKLAGSNNNDESAESSVDGVCFKSLTKI
jgi:hypothetical protein